MGERVSADAIKRDRDASRERAKRRRARLSGQEHEENLKERRKYEANNRGHINELRRASYISDYDVLNAKPFIGWDGEGYTADDGSHHYMLFGCSQFPDNPVVGRSLSTQECLDYILYVESCYPNAIHFGFSFEYDVNMILKDLSESQFKHLRDYNTTLWRNYRIHHIPGKMFRVTRLSKSGNKTATIYDVFGFFHASFISALFNYKIGDKQTVARIEAGKIERGNFAYDDIEYVLKYWQDEISLYPPLMDKIREMCWDAELYIHQWHGPGALASCILANHKYKEWKSKDVPFEVQIATQHAFAGGRFQYWRCGLWRHPVYTADLNSAYIYACSLLPRLDNGHWVRVPVGQVDRKNIARFGLYHIKYDAGFDKTRVHHRAAESEEIFPLFHRNKSNNISWPHRTEGWYWSPEASLVADDPDAEFVSAWVYQDDGTYPFEWVSQEYDKRLELKRDKNPAEKVIKWALAAVYGAFAQRVGWDQKKCKPPRSHELAWAGFITSWCRAEVHKLGKRCREQDALISIDTDGVTSSVPFEAEWLDRGEGKGLGQWELEEHAGILYWGSGFYWLLDTDGEWSTAKSRGFPKGKIKAQEALDALEQSTYELGKQDTAATIHKTSEHFTGYREALQSNGGLRNARRWTKRSHNLYMGRGGQIWHTPNFCPKCRDPELDIMHITCHNSINSSAHFSPLSSPHKLPWLEPQDKMPEDRLIIRDIDEADFLS